MSSRRAGHAIARGDAPRTTCIDQSDMPTHARTLGECFFLFQSPLLTSSPLALALPSLRTTRTLYSLFVRSLDHCSAWPSSAFILGRTGHAAAKSWPRAAASPRKKPSIVARGSVVVCGTGNRLEVRNACFHMPTSSDTVVLIAYMAISDVDSCCTVSSCPDHRLAPLTCPLNP